MPPAARLAIHDALLAAISNRARESPDRNSFLVAVLEDVRRAFGASGARFVNGNGAVPELTSAPLAIDGTIDQVLVLDFEGSGAFDEVGALMLRSAVAHIGAVTEHAGTYELERARRARAESLERIVRMMRDTQTPLEVMLVFASTVSHEVGLGCAIYKLEGSAATLAAARGAGARRTAAQTVDVSDILPLLDRHETIESAWVAGDLRAQLFGAGEGMLAGLRIDGALWGFVMLAGARPEDWTQTESRIYLRTLLSHLELALSGAQGYARIRHLARALSESNQFKDDLLAMVAHDFKGPLTVILGYCELLLQSADPEAREELDTISSQARRLVQLSEDAVLLAETEVGGFTLDRTCTDLREVLEESARAHNLECDRIQLAVPDGPVRISIDRARFNHVLDNLLMNALKYSRGAVKVRLKRSEDGASISVSDNGIGIPAAELSAIFTRFGRASNARAKGISGSGVGLYVSRKIVEAHGGSLAVRSREGRGSTFSVTLPLGEDEAR